MTKTKQLVLCAVLTAVALGLSYVERMIPLNLIVPLPGVKLGLANIVTLMALYFLSTKTAVTILVLRCLLNAIFGGGITGLAFSLTGGLLSVMVMALSRRLPFLSIYGVSILGAAAHNIGQILAAMAMMGSVYILVYLPFLLMISVLTGLITGAAAGSSLRALSKTGLVPEMGRKENGHAGKPR